MKRNKATVALALLGWAALCNAQETVNGGITMLGPLRSNGSLAVVDFTAAGSTSPVKSGALAARPGTCIVGQMYFATDAAPGQNLAYCTAPGTWTVGAGSGTAGPCQLATALGFALNGIDETALLNTTFANFYSAGGGCLAINNGKTLRADGQIVLPNSGAPYYTQPPYRITSIGNAGGYGDTSTQAGQTGGTLDLRYSGNSSYPQYGNGPKILSMGHGDLVIDNVTITDGGTDCAAYLMVTGSALYAHNTTFWGQHGLGSGCNDAIILGGTTENNQPDTGTIADHFSGYGSIIRDNRFLGVARAVWGQSAVNGIVIDGNFIMGGNSTSKPNAIDLIGYATGIDSSRANVIKDNTIELGWGHNYGCGIHLQKATNNIITGNGFWDGDLQTYALCGDGTAINNNVDRTNYVDVTGTRFTDPNWSSNNYMPFKTVAFFFDGGGAALSGTTSRCSLISFGGTINQFSMAADQAGAATVTVKAVGLGSYTGPASAVDISNGGEPLSGAAWKQDSNLAGWNYAGTNPASGPLQPNTMVCFTLSNPSGITWLTGQIQLWEGR